MQIVHHKRPWVIPVVFTFIILEFIADYVSPLGMADYILYFIPIALTVNQHRSGLPILSTLLATAMVITGFYISPEGDAEDVARFNRMFAIIAMWSVAFLVRKIIINRNATDSANWVKTGLNMMAEKVRGELSLDQISQQILAFLTSYTEAQIGSIYTVVENKKELRFTAGHAFTRDENTKDFYNFGEGFVGQCALDQRPLEIFPVPSNYMKISSSLGSAQPHHIILVPLISDDKTIAVIELAYSEELSQMQKTFLEQISEPTAIAIKSSLHKAKLLELLQKSQEMTHELQAQQEELRVVNEELEQQSKALKESYSKLENQQAELEQTNQQLEEQAQNLETQSSLLNERNRDLMQIKVSLEEKAQELRKASQYKSEFLANMSHELRTPLNSSLILAKLLSDNKGGNLTEEQVQYAEIIYSSGNDLLNLINDILDLSKVEAGKMTVNPEKVQIPQIVKNLNHTFSHMARDKNIDFIVAVDESAPGEITTDRFRLDQILKNFLSNAFKFTDKGSVTLRVYLDAGEISFAVTDTGIGISEEQQNVIFEAFRQADGTTNRKYGGTGLGLSISKELARILGGEITIQSTPGKGSTFKLHLPLVLNDSMAQEAPQGDIIKGELPPPPTVKNKQSQTMDSQGPILQFSFQDDRETIENFSRKMLIIEDDEPFAKILFDLAHEMNFGALVAPTADEGVNLAKTYLPHAIALDIRLPDHSGLMVLDQLKMNAKTRHIPVHVISSSDFSKSVMDMGAIGYMLKPVKREQIQEAFEHLTSVMNQKMKHVLVVEDDKVQKDHIVRLISDSKVEVEAVETAKEALEKLSKKTYDCLIMDLSLPDLSGHELLDKLATDQTTYSYPPVIVYTARDLPREEEEKLRKYSQSIIIKSAKSPERLLSEVTLFLHRVENELPPERQKMLKDLRSREKTLDKRKILVVDDDIRNIFSLTSALENYGAKVEVARNGREALVKLNAMEKVDLVLMDIMMPEMDGYEAISRARKERRFAKLPIIALTAKAMRDDQEKCLAAGANDYLAKPLDLDKLLSLIRVWLPEVRGFIS